MSRKSRSELILPLLVLAGCLAPRPGEEGEVIGIDEVGRMIGEGAEPVLGTVEEGRVVPEGDPTALADPAAVDFQETEDEQEEPRENPYIHFGERIMVHTHPVTGETLITKPYPLPEGKGQRMLDLIRAIEPFPYTLVPVDDKGAPVPSDQPPNPEVVELLVMPGWDTEQYIKRATGPAITDPSVADSLVISDLLVATATYDLLDEMEDFVNLFGAGVRQIEIEAKIVEVVDSDTFDFGIQMGSADFPDNTLVDAFDFQLPNVSDPVEALLTLGAVQDGVQFDLILEALQTFSNVSIDQQPKVAVREGVPATIASTREIPYQKIGTFDPNTGNVSTTLDYISVGIQLYVAPRVVGTDTLAIDVHVISSQFVGSINTLSGTVTSIDTPVVATRTAKTVVYLQPGQSLIIGGLTSERIQEIEQQVPILGDIPLVGRIFRSTFESTETTYSMFVISPRIIQGNEFNAEL